MTRSTPVTRASGTGGAASLGWRLLFALLLGWGAALAAATPGTAVANQLPEEALEALAAHLEAAGSPLAGRAVPQLEAAWDEVALVRLSPLDPAAEPALAFLRFGDGGWTVLGVGRTFSAEFYDAHDIPDGLQVYGVQDFALQDAELGEPPPLEAPPKYRPVADELCAAWAAAVEEEVGASVEGLEAPFEDFVSGTGGRACRLTATGTGEDFGAFPLVAADLVGRLAEEGWHEDPRYAADGPTGTTIGLRREDLLAIVRVGWEPADAALCPEDRPVFECEIAPADQLYTIRLELAQEVPEEEADMDERANLPPAARRAAEALAERLGVEPESVTVVSADYVEWPDACLGLAAPGQMCAQVITPGYRIALEAGGRSYLYHSDASGRSVLPADAPRLEGGQEERF